MNSPSIPLHRQLCGLKKACLVDRLLGTSVLLFIMVLLTLGTATMYFTERAERVQIQEVYQSTLNLRKEQRWFKKPVAVPALNAAKTLSFPQLPPNATFVSCK